MRLVALVALAVLAAGCLQSSNTTPTPAPSQGGATSTTTTTSTPSDATQPTPNSPSPSGGPPQGGMLVRPPHNESSEGGFTLVADESASGFIPPGDVTFRIQARNDGPGVATANVPCYENGNPQIVLTDENGTQLDLTGPQMRCQAIAVKPLAPGDSIWTNLTWNGKAYKDGQAFTVPPGHYTATATFTASRGTTQTQLTVSIPVNVLDSSSRGAL